MSPPQVVSQAELEAAREELLVKEKEATRARDALAAERRRLPMVRIHKGYLFERRPAGWPQTPPYEWWRRHDEYEEATSS